MFVISGWHLRLFEELIQKRVMFGHLDVYCMSYGAERALTMAKICSNWPLKFGMALLQVTNCFFFDSRFHTWLSDKHVTPGIPENCPTEIKAILEKCWQVDPKERPTFSQLVKQLKPLSVDKKNE